MVGDTKPMLHWTESLNPKPMLLRTESLNPKPMLLRTESLNPCNHFHIDLTTLECTCNLLRNDTFSVTDNVLFITNFWSLNNTYFIITLFTNGEICKMS